MWMKRKGLNWSRNPNKFSDFSDLWSNMHFCILNTLLNMWKPLWDFHDLTKNERRVVKEISAVRYITYGCISQCLSQTSTSASAVTLSCVLKKKKLKKIALSNCLKLIEPTNVKRGYSKSGKKPLDFPSAWFYKFRFDLIRVIMALRTKKLVPVFHFYISAVH